MEMIFLQFILLKMQQNMELLLFQEIDEDLVKSGAGLASRDGLSVEDFGLADSAITAGAALTAGAPIAEDFEAAVRWLRRLLRPA